MMKRINIWVTSDARPLGLALAFLAVIAGCLLIGVALASLP